MVVFLTSSPTGSRDGKYRVDGLDTANHFRDNLRSRWREGADCLMITAFPDNKEANDEMQAFFHGAFEQSGLSCGRFDLWDDDTVDTSAEALHSYDVIILGGGHVPTQSEFFRRLNLREKIAGFDGIVIGISAGSMNAADVVYAQPEENGEAVDPNYKRWLPGLGLTQTMIIPHYQMVKDRWLDGRRLYEDITYEDSREHDFLALVDGSYLLVENGREMVCGEAYEITDGRLSKISDWGDILPWR